MAQDHGRLRTSDGPLQPSTFSSARSDYGTGSGFDHDPHRQVSVASFGGGGYPVPAHGGAPSLGTGQPRVALPANVKLPPSMMSTYQTHPRLPQQQMMKAMPNPHTVTYHPPVPTSSTSAGCFAHGPHPIQEFGAADVIRQLDLAADENNRLRGRLKENNMILEEKVQEIQRCLQSRDRDKETMARLQSQLEQTRREAAEKREEAQQRKSMPARVSDTTAADETTNKLFEAQVAVMGFKCRVMQLQGELDDRQREGWADAAAREEIEHLRTENATLRGDLKKVKEERDLARKQKTPSPQSASSSPSARIERELTNLVLSQEVVIKEVNQQLSDKRHLHHTETQRMAAQSQQQQSHIASLQAELGRLQGLLASQQQSSGLQAEIDSLRSELGRAQNQLATQQQNYELRLTSLTTQTNMARQDQARAQELGKQLTVTHAEISKLNQDLRDVRKEAEKYKKKSELSESKVKDSSTKMMSMQDQLTGQKSGVPVPKPRGDIAQLKSEIESLQTELATTRSNYERERRTREGVETEVQVKRTKIQELLMKNNQLQAQLGTGGGGGREQGELELEVERLKRENSRAEAALAELEKEKKEAVDAKIDTEAKLAQTQEELTTLRGSQSGPGKLKPKPLEVRLNDYAGKLAHLEGVFDNERKEKSKVETSLRQEKQRTEELESRVQVLEREKSHVEDETVRNLQQQKSEVERCLREKEMELVETTVRHQEELDRLRAETAVQKQNYEKKIDEKEVALRGKERELEMVQQSTQRGHSEKEGEVAELRTNLRRASSQLQQKESEIVQIRSELHSHETQLHTLVTEKENLRANESQISSRLRETLQENDRLKNELTKTQKVTGEFRKECESLVGDYQTAAKKIELLEKERDRFRNQTDMGMRELAMRAERIKALEAERQSLQDQLQHMDLQLKQYMADFRSEREMRESAFQVKEMAERRQHELSGEVSTLQKQLTELQTVNHFDADVSDDPGAVGGGGGGGGRQWSGGRAIPTPRLAPTDPSASPLAAPPLPPKPGGDFNFPRHQNVQQQQPHHHHHQSQPQQYVGGVSQVLPPHHHGQELVTSATPFPQARPPPVSQPPVAMPTGMSPRQHSGGSPYAPNSRVDPVLMDPHRPPMGGGVPPPEPRFGPMPPVSAQQMGGPHGPGAMRPAPVSAASQYRPARTSEGKNWFAPGDVVNKNLPEVACPLCSRNDFATVTDLEIHCARCTGPS